MGRSGLRDAAEEIGHREIAFGELEPFDAGVGVLYLAVVLGRVVALDLELVAVGVGEVDAVRHAVVDGEGNRHIFRLDLLVGGDELLPAFQPEGDVNESDGAGIRARRLAADLEETDLVVVVPVRGQERDLRRLDLSHDEVEPEHVQVEALRTLEVANLDDDVGDACGRIIGWIAWPDFGEIATTIKESFDSGTSPARR